MPKQRDHQLDAVIDGSALLVSFTLDEDEHRRRRESGVGAVTDEMLLAALLSLPEDSLGRVEPRFERLFDAPSTSEFATVVDDPEGGRWAQRTLRCPVHVDQIEAFAESWRHGLRIAHTWAGYGPRVVRVSEAPDTVLPCMEASRYGVGFVTDNALLVAPAEYRPRRWTAARWRFAELVYARYVS